MESKYDPRTKRAITAMHGLGIESQTIIPVLRRLLKLYNQNWELIEENNFQTLADAIFEHAEDKVKDEKDSDTINEDVEPPLKKSNRGHLKDGVSSSREIGQNIVHVKEGRLPKAPTGIRIPKSSSVSRDLASEAHRTDYLAQRGGKGKEIVPLNSAHDKGKSSNWPASGALHANHEPNDSGLGPKMRKTAVGPDNKNTVVPRKKQPVDHSSQLPTPVSQKPGSVGSSQDMGKKRDRSSSVCNHQATFETAYDLASSTGGQVRVSLMCDDTLLQHDIHSPSADEVLRFVERHSQKFSATFETQLSLVKSLEELCERFSEMVTSRPQSRRIVRNYVNQPLGPKEDTGNGNPESDQKKRESNCSQSSNSHNLVLTPQKHGEQKRVFHKINDITKGTEKVKISLLDEIGIDVLPRFSYCPENITYESAYVHVSLARISNEDSCPRCKEDCMLSSIPCACARDTGGEFAYTPEGLLTEKFLKTCINMKDEPRHQDLFYCQECPLERAKGGSMPEKCKGHLLRMFIKECWRKCGCSMKCGNRVVQRGIMRKLQVFSTGKGKGWGLRTLEGLPEGAFVCEYVGEILTNIELYERNKKSNGKDRHVYPVLLDADWATEGVLKDEDALCLDATRYGNVARFINHRCFDGNVIEVPVQVETPDRHYYHLAFFTKRKVEALEELTWDYGIDFDDENHPIRAFRCCCGSRFCRDRKSQH